MTTYDLHPDWHMRALAGLAFQRARVFDALTGLDEQTLTGVPVHDTWTAKDILAHLAGRDRLFVAAFGDALAGRPIEEADYGVEPYNAILYATARDWPLERVLAECVAARAAVMTVIRETSAEALLCNRGLPWGDGTLRYWLAPRAHHDEEHAADLTAWRKNLGPAAQTSWHEQGPRCLLLAGLAAWREALALQIALIPPEQRATRPVVGTWTLCDVVGHIADWEWLDAQVLAEALRGREPAIGAIDDVDAWNATHAAARAGRPWEAAWEDFEAARFALLRALNEADEAALNTPRAGTWGGAPYRWAYVCLDHDREHTEDLCKPH